MGACMKQGRFLTLVQLISKYVSFMCAVVGTVVCINRRCGLCLQRAYHLLRNPTSQTGETQIMKACVRA